MSLREDADIIFKYAVLGYSMEKIGNELGISYNDVSFLLTPYHMGGKENKSGEGNYSSGKNRGRYSNGFTCLNELGDREHVEITQDIIWDYVRANERRDPKQTLEEFLQRRYGRVPSADEERRSFRAEAVSSDSYSSRVSGISIPFNHQGYALCWLERKS